MGTWCIIIQVLDYSNCLCFNSEEGRLSIWIVLALIYFHGLPMNSRKGRLFIK